MNANEDAFDFFECSNYRVQRHMLQRVIIGFASFTVQTLYGSKHCTYKENGVLFQAVHQYIRTTGKLGAVTYKLVFIISCFQL